MSLRDEPGGVPVLHSAVGYHGRVWDVVEDRIDYNGQELFRHYIAHPGAAAIVAIDDDERVLLIQQYRHPISSREWEIPAGLHDVAGEDHLAGAQRELAEEADLVAAHWESLGTFALSPGSSAERIDLYLATGLSPAPETFAREDEESDMRLEWVPLEEVLRAIREGRFGNATLALGVLLAADRIRSREA
ncbi:NUDIX hydrolase [Microbacterium sp. Marseille-Q6965]|uniref:NUDIX domain-containing protein n=1 Tax=Microbacterium sp. Marseille-Q6965 TaxID=2965072 RepID=UPI0021B7415A|nr:NUDIX hydrolase [Microbacterium sp. Marseille-Q6965]